MTLNLSWPLALVIVAVVAALAWIYTVEKKSPKEEKKKFRNPFVVTIIVSFAIILLLLVMEGLGVMPEGWAKDHWYLFILLIIGIFYWSFQSIAKLRPLSMEKLERAAWELIYKRFKAREHKGLSFGPPIPYHKVTETKDNGVFNKVVNFLCRTSMNWFVLVRLDINNAYSLECIANPDIQYIQRLFGKEVAQQFDIERELLKKSIEPEAYAIQQEQNEVQTAPATA